MKSLLPALLLAALCLTAPARTIPTDAEAETQARALLARMTIGEKALQLLSYTPNAVPRLGIPSLAAGEALHGVVTNGATCFPQSIALAATWDPQLVGQAAGVIAAEARAVGIHQAFAPMLGLARDPRWGRVEESYGEDPYLCSRLAVAYINGLQGQGADRLGENHIFATPKHFVADGEPFAGANGEDYDISERILREIYMQPFEAAVREAHTVSIMPAHHGLNGIPCHANHWLLTDVLRGQWGFSGFVTSDMGDIPKLTGGHKYTHNDEEAAVAALSAGVDMELTGNLYKLLPRAVADGTLPQPILDQAVLRVLKAKIQLLGLSTPAATSGTAQQNETQAALAHFDSTQDVWAKLIADGKFTTPESARRPDWQSVLNDPAHDQLALKAAGEALVLLKNEQHLLPLHRDQLRHVLVVGPLATQRNVGGYSTGRPKFYIDVVQGLKEALPGAQVSYDQGCNLTDPADTLLPQAVSDAASADVIIAVLGHGTGQARENLDRDNLQMPGGQEKLLEAMQQTGKPLVMVLENGDPVIISWAQDHVHAILETWYLGQAAGKAIAAALLGDLNPGGRLPVSFPRTLGQIPCYYYHTPFHGPINYFQSKPGPLYPFGFGLSYTTFTYSPATVQPAAITPSQQASVKLTVRNTGPVAGDEVVQCYLRQDYTSLKRPERLLRSFRRVTLQPGEQKEILFTLGMDDFKFWKNGKWVVEPGTVKIQIGASSADIRSQTSLHLTEGAESAP